MGVKQQDRIALDRASVRTFDENSGHLHVDRANLSRACINPYNGDEIPGGKELGLDPNKTYRLYRDPAELEKAAKTIDGKPLLLAHKPVAVDDHDHANVVGSISEPRYDHPHLTGKLAVWTRDAIDAIQSGKQRELSCGYHYRYDPTPGSVDGQQFDGVMRDLSFNHCALVAEGRAGPTCYIGDELPSYLKDTSMTKTVLSRKAVAAQGALVAYLAPKMAQDSKKIDWTPTFKDVTSKNFKAKAPAIAADVLTQLKGAKLAKDENVQLEQIAAVLEAVASVDPVEPTMPAPGADPVTEDDDDAPLRAALKDLGILDDDIEKVLAKAKGGAPGKDSAPSNMGTASTSEFSGSNENSNAAGGGSTRTYAPSSGESEADVGAADEDDDDDKKEKDKKAMDAAFKAQLKGMVSKSAMDQAIAASVKTATDAANKNQRDIREAERFVRPWVGDLAMSFDSAPDVFRTALKSLNIENVEKLHPDALRPILEAQRKPGERPRSSVEHVIAQDSAASKARTEMFPNYNRLKK